MKMKELLEKPETWTQGAHARDKDDNPANDLGDTACKFCLIGALNRCYEDSDTERAKAYRVLGERIGPNIAKWNDDPVRTHQEVLELVTRLDI